MKSTSLFKSLSLLVFLNFLVKPVWILFIDRQVQNSVGQEAYGSYFAILNLSIVLSFIADAGLTNMVNQQLASGTAFSLKQIIRYKVFLSLLYVGLVFSVASFSGLKNWFLISGVVFIQLLTSYLVLLRNIITAHQYFGTDAWLSVIDKGLMILLAGSFIYLPVFAGINVRLFLTIQIICTTFSILIAVFILNKKKISTKGQVIGFAKIIQAMLPFSVIILLMGMHYRLDGFLLNLLYTNGAYETGVYAGAYRLLDASNMVGYLAASFIVPFIAKNKSNILLVEETIHSLRHLLLLGCAVLVTFTLVFAPELQQLLYHNNNAHNISVLQLCLMALPGYFLVHIYGSLLTATNQLRTFIAITTLAVLLNIVLNLLLIRTYGAAGCCVAAIASQSFCGLACFIIGSKKTGIQLSLKTMFLYIISAIGLYFIFYWGKNAALNYWLLFGLGSFMVLLILFTQIAYFRKLFFNFR
ncbi:MAG: hypothetical protein C4330_02095 [Chitinophagaceae bacterium]